ncbi:PhzF family phenazine biosynthesis protein [Vibrio taketomensis]|uniref:PhzF family phenazine biosynthesis protein n=1 Tax=Vibrio taketomensis TaxID=2572923 RepID=UPI00138A5AD7|nr:PhzF family phenazine biosynthesis protein [Vibrio taketomensis]
MLLSDIYDVFTSEGAQGNPCGVVFLECNLPDSELLEITRAMNQPVTSFLLLSDKGYQLRWFALSGEINLCGHGSLGAGAALLADTQDEEVRLTTRYGEVTVCKQDSYYQISLPTWETRTPVDLDSIKVLVASAKEAFSTRDLVVVMHSIEEVDSYQPNFELIKQFDSYHALIITAQNGNDGYVLRYFAPSIGIDEDIATGSAQCSLAPYWLAKLEASRLKVSQLSSAGGYFEVEQPSAGVVTISAQVKKR